MLINHRIAFAVVVKAHRRFLGYIGIGVLCNLDFAVRRLVVYGAAQEYIRVCNLRGVLLGRMDKGKLGRAVRRLDDVDAVGKNKLVQVVTLCVVGQPACAGDGCHIDVADVVDNRLAVLPSQDIS